MRSFPKQLAVSAVLLGLLAAGAALPGCQSPECCSGHYHALGHGGRGEHCPR